MGTRSWGSPTAAVLTLGPWRPGYPGRPGTPSLPYRREKRGVTGRLLCSPALPEAHAAPHLLAHQPNGAWVTGGARPTLGTFGPVLTAGPRHADLALRVEVASGQPHRDHGLNRATASSGPWPQRVHGLNRATASTGPWPQRGAAACTYPVSFHAHVPLEAGEAFLALRGWRG